MKEFFQGIITLIGAIIISIFQIPIGFAYSVGYAIWLSITLKELGAFPRYLWRLVDGMFAAVGWMFVQFAIFLDYLWNVNGENIEDWVTTKEDTSFSKKLITVSASIGELEHEDALLDKGKRFSRWLNIAFNQKSHAKDSWDYHVLHEKLRNSLFGKRK